MKSWSKKKTESLGYLLVKLHDRTVTGSGSIPACDRQMDGQTDMLPIAKSRSSIDECNNNNKKVISILKCYKHS